MDAGAPGLTRFAKGEGKAVAMLFASAVDDAAAWRAALAAHAPELEVRVWPDAGRAADIEAALVWRPETGMLARFPALKAVFSLGAGADHVFADSALPDVPVVRLVDPALTRQMVEYVLLAALHAHRRMDEYRAFQARAVWRQLPACDTASRRVGVMGLGEIGRACAAALAGLGFPVAAWRRGAGSDAGPAPDPELGIPVYFGPGGLPAFLARTDIPVCLLPLTRKTGGILNAELFARLPRGAYVVNAARGGCQNEDDLLAAIDSGQLAGAWLDVCRTEPLPPSSPLWRHPRITLTPHVAGWVIPETAAAQIVANLRRVRAGLAPRNVVDPARGY